MYNIEQNTKLGYYRVGDQTFFSKPQALIYATKTNNDVNWVFNLREYGLADWGNEPETNIRELYRLRAQQLRDKYDYIRIEASGGADSTTAIFSFLLNGIHLDEVVFRYPKQGERGMVGDASNTNATNTLSEWEFAAKPLLNWISVNYPTTKVTFHDYSNDMISSDYLKDESWVFTTRDYFQPGHGIKHIQDSSAEQKDLLDSGKSICIVYGVDKPRLEIIEETWCAYFTDLHANIPNPAVGQYSNLTSELFFWAPEFPEIVVKQAHLVKNWVELPENNHHQRLFRSTYGINNRSTYEQLVKCIIYPDYDLCTWQTDKPTSSFFNEMDHWFYTNFKDTTLFSAWEAGQKYLVDNIHPRFFKTSMGVPTGFHSMFSPFYAFGKVNPKMQPPVFKNSDYLKAGTSTPVLVIENKKQRIASRPGVK